MGNKNSTMTPKEKAAELYKKYDAIKHSVSTHVQHKRVIECCLIAVMEIIQATYHFSTFEYWRQVQHEIVNIGNLTTVVK